MYGLLLALWPLALACTGLRRLGHIIAAPRNGQTIRRVVRWTVHVAILGQLLVSLAIWRVTGSTSGPGYGIALGTCLVVLVVVLTWACVESRRPRPKLPRAVARMKGAR